MLENIYKQPKKESCMLKNYLNRVNDQLHTIHNQQLIHHLEAEVEISVSALLT
jgi:radical SAM superfamily enzyme